MSWYKEWEAEKIKTDHESARKAAQNKRDKSLSSMTHTFSDGRVVQIRPNDLPNFQTAMSLGVDRKWILADNTTSILTVEEMQEAVQHGVSKGNQIWDEYTSDIENL